jgi:putative tryptophan/tyrosine transport system substrate-binding protein
MPHAAQRRRQPVPHDRASALAARAAAERMNRRRLLVAGIAAVAWRPALAAPRPNARVGYLELVRASDGERLYREFIEGLQSHGYVEGRNLRMLRRSADAKPDRVRNLAPELADAKVDVILASSVEAARWAKFGAPRVPTVFVISGDPVLEGLVASLARPQGNLTGVIAGGEDLTAKRLELLKEAFPRIRSVAVVGSNLAMSRVSIDAPARRLQLEILRFPMHDVDEYRQAAAEILRSTADAVLVVEDAEAVANLAAFVRLMMATRRPVMFNADVFVEDFGLMAFGVSLRQQYRRAARYVAQVLEGAKPAQMPVEQPTRYELLVNLRMAEEYGIVLPREFLLRADRVIK